VVRVVIPQYSFIIPVFNERETLPELHRRLDAVMAQLDGPAEVVFVDDGSTDGSFAILEELHARDPRVKALRLSRNFGHQIALSAGLDHALGDAVIIMDGDLQDPPEVALEMAKRWREGFDVVYAVREERVGESRMKLATAKWFYRLIGRMSEVAIPLDAGDFRLVDRRAVDAVASMREHSRYLRGMFAWVGYDQTGIHYSRAARYAGRTKFPLRKMVAFATDGIISFSAAPLRLALALGFVVSALSLLGGLVAVALRWTGVLLVPGWASIVVAISFLGGVQLTVLGVMGLYIARIYDEVKQRPLYFVRDRIGGADDREAETRAPSAEPVETLDQ
jgi:polyisoprenyl-phosphate glycosyltransferase